jgi:hypothetical protein
LENRGVNDELLARKVLTQVDGGFTGKHSLVRQQGDRRLGRPGIRVRFGYPMAGKALVSGFFGVPYNIPFPAPTPSLSTAADFPVKKSKIAVS